MNRPPFDYATVAMTDEELVEEREVYGGLAESVRRLSEATLRTTVDAETVIAVRKQVDELTAQLTVRQIPGSYGVNVTTTGQVRGHGNAVVGMRNPIAVPLHITQDREKGTASAEFELNALYEGPPGMVHGGVTALVLDQVCGEAAAAGGAPGMTGTLTLRYLKPTPLGPCSAVAWVERTDGHKTVVKGELRCADGEVTVETEGLFILPRWAREQLEKHGPPQYE